MVRVFANAIVRETGVQSQVESYQRVKKWYLMPPCLTLCIIRYGSKVKLSNPRKAEAPSRTPWCSSYRKRSHPRLRSPTLLTLLGSPLPQVALYIYIYIYIYLCVCVCVCVLFDPVKPELGGIPSLVLSTIR